MRIRHYGNIFITSETLCGLSPYQGGGWKVDFEFTSDQLRVTCPDCMLWDFNGFNLVGRAKLREKLSRVPAHGATYTGLWTRPGL